MIKPINDNNYFNEEQIKRIYEVYEFGDDEEIEAAWYEDGQLYVDYSSPTGGNVYMPSIDDESDDTSGVPEIIFPNEPAKVQDTIDEFTEVVHKIQCRDYSTRSTSQTMCNNCDLRHFCKKI